MDERHTWPYHTKSGCLICYLLLMTNHTQNKWRYYLTLSREIDQKNLATFPWWLSTCKKITVDSLLRYWWSKNPATGLDKRQNWPHPTNSSILRFYLLLLTCSMQKNRDIIWLFFPCKKTTVDSLLRCWWSKKNPVTWLDESHNLLHPSKSSGLRSYLSLMAVSMQKI